MDKHKELIEIKLIIQKKLKFYDNVEPMAVNPNIITNEIMAEIDKLSNN